MMLNKFGIGSKIIVSISLMLALCMGLMSAILISLSMKTSAEDAEKLLVNTSKRAGNALEGYINEIFVALNYSQRVLDTYLRSNMLNESNMQETLATLLDSNQWMKYAYIYIKDASKIKGLGKQYLLQDGGALIYGIDNEPNRKGGIEILPNDLTILSDSGVQEALKKAKVSVGDPTLGATQQQDSMRVTLNYPIFSQDGAVEGVVGVTLHTKLVAEDMFSERRKVFPDAYRVLLTNDSALIVHPNEGFLGRTLRDINKENITIKPLLDALEKGTSGIYEFINLYGKDSMAGLASFEVGRGLSGKHWGTIIIAPKDSVYQSVYTLVKIIAISVILCVIVVSLFTFVYVRTTIARRIYKISHTL
ncbi:PDC sensor domain-containing protein, partial [Helicobacter marmotae]